MTKARQALRYTIFECPKCSRHATALARQHSCRGGVPRDDESTIPPHDAVWMKPIGETDRL